MNVSVVNVVIPKLNALYFGSLLLGYAWSVVPPSIVHLKVIPSVIIPTVFAVVKPWDAFVITKFPFDAS